MAQSLRERLCEVSQNNKERVLNQVINDIKEKTNEDAKAGMFQTYISQPIAWRLPRQLFDDTVVNFAKENNLDYKKIGDNLYLLSWLPKDD